MKSYEFILKNLDCANCANKIQNTLDQNKELSDVVVNFNTLKLKYKTNTLLLILFRLRLILLQFNLSGGVPERLIGAVLKTVVPSRVPWVRIPPSPFIMNP